MRITRLHLDGFKSHDQLELEPAPGLTIVRGPNEAGKSSIQQAIGLALFRKADANREDIRRAWRWGAQEPPEVSMDFEVDGVSGTLRKRFGGPRSEAELTLNGQTVSDYQLIQDKLTELVGVPSEAFYRATASVSHADLGSVAGAEAAIGDRLQKAVSGADRGTAKAKKKLETAIHRYRTEGHKNPGLLKVVRAEIAQLQGDLADGEQALARLEADRARWVESSERLEELEVKLSRLQAELAEAQRAEGLAAQRDEALERWDRLKRAVALIEEEDRLRRARPTTLQLPQVRSAVSRLQSLEFEVSELEAEIETTIEAAGEETVEEAPPRPSAWLAAAAILALSGWAALIVLRGAGLVGVAVVIAIAVALAVCLVQAARLAGRRRKWGLAQRMAEQAVAVHEQLARDQQEQLRRKQREMAAVLESLGALDLAGARSLLEALEMQTEQLAKIEGELRGLGVDHDNARRLEDDRDQAANDVELARHALAAMGPLAEEPAVARGSAQREISATAPLRDEARSEADQAQGRIDANAVDAETVAGLAERLAAARDRQAELERRVIVYEGTMAAIVAAEQATLKTAARYLEEHMGPAIATLTDGRYDDIEVDEKSLAFKVRAPETGEYVDIDQLSQGTADQLFLAARLGLVRLVTLDRRPPLLLDDPLVTFDAGRAERALRLVRRFAHEQGFQVLYFCCSDRYDRLADDLVVLPGPTSERVLAQPQTASAAGLAAERSPAPESAPEPTRPAETPTAARVAAAPAPATQQTDGPGPTITFAPDPRPNPDPVAPHRTEDAAEPTLFPPEDDGRPLEADEAATRLATLRAARARQEPDRPDPVAALRQAAAADADGADQQEAADPFSLRDDEGASG